MAQLHFNNGDAISAAVLAGLGGYILIEARQWPYLAEDGPGPGFFPMWYGIGLLVLSLIVIGARIHGLVQGRRGTGLKDADKREIRHALSVWAVFALSIALLKVLGFLLAFGLLTLYIVSVVYARPWRTGLVTAAATSLGFHLVFPLALNVALPVGVLGF